MHALLSVTDALAPSTIYEYTTPDTDPVPYKGICLAARSTCGRVRNLSLKQLDALAFTEYMREALPKEERTYYAPTVNAMSGVVLSNVPFTIHHTIDRVRRIVRPGYLRGSDDLRIPCDGTVIGKHDGFIMSAGGCPLVVLTGMTEDGKGFCIAAHAGRNSLIDPLQIKKGQASRAQFSVVNAMVAYAKKHYSALPEDMLLRSFFGLPSTRFAHDPRDAEFGSINRRLHRELIKRGQGDALRPREDGIVCLWLPELIRIQAQQEGIGYIDTSRLSLPEYGDFAYTKHPDEEMGGSVRNLVVLTRH